MSVTLRVPTVLRKLTAGQDEIETGGTTVAQVLEEVGGRYNGFLERVRPEPGGVQPFLNLFVNGEDVRFAQGLATPVSDGDEVSIIPSIAGG
jgi:molybdopterin synthase sulfur carrier subunit